MQDTFINLGRGIDGMVGRMVDRFGEAENVAHPPAGGKVELLRYAIVSVAADQERVLHVDEILVTCCDAGRAGPRRLRCDPSAASRRPPRTHLSVPRRSRKHRGDRSLESPRRRVPRYARRSLDRRLRICRPQPKRQRRQRYLRVNSTSA
jgi:hypothetical protein